MARRSSNTVRAYYPESDVRGLVKKVAAAAERIAARIPLGPVRVLRGRKAASDVDLLVVYSGKRRDDACRDALEVYNAELHIYTQEEYRNVMLSGSPMAKEIRKAVTVWKGPPLRPVGVKNRRAIRRAARWPSWCAF